jgi:glycosyltransferase involved in cell wall biosynthesis
MRILHTIRSVDPKGGGAVECVKQLARVHERQGIHVEFASMDAPDDSWVAEFPHLLHAFGPVRFNYAFAPRFTSWLAQARKAYDAVIIHGLWLYNSFGAWRALRATDTPYFVFPHGMLDPWFKQHYPLKHLKKSLYWPWAEYRVLRDARAVLFTAEEERQLARRSFSLYRANERIVPLGIESPAGVPAKLVETFLDAFPLHRGKRLLLFLGRLHEKKGCERLLHAFASECRDLDGLHLMMAGPCADNAYLEKLRTVAASFGNRVSSRITWPGMLTGDLKWGALHSAEAFILPSHQENFGIAVVEALACGTPVLLSDRVNIWREIEQADAGVVAPPDNAGTRQLVSEWAKMDSATLTAMGENARRCFREHYEADRAAAGLTRALNEN